MAGAFDKHRLESGAVIETWWSVEAKGEYVLPVRFDDTDLPGLVPTIAYLDARRVTPRQLAGHILQKIEVTTAAPIAAKAPVVSGVARLAKMMPGDFSPYAEAERFFRLAETELTSRAKALHASGYVSHNSNRTGTFKLRIVRSGDTKFALDLWVGGGMGGEETLNFHHGGRETITPGSMTGWGTVVWDPTRGQAAIRLTVLGFSMGNDSLLLSAEEFVDYLWNLLIEILESSPR